MDKKTLLAFLLIAGIHMFIPYYYKVVGLAPSPKGDQGASPLPARDHGEAITPGYASEPPLWSPPKVGPPSGLHLSSEPVDPTSFQVETLLFSATISSVGGGTITSFSLKNYFDSDSGRVQLIRAGVNDLNPLVEFKDISGNSVLLDIPFALGAGTYDGQVLSITDREEVVSFLFETTLGTVTKKLTFYPNSYLIGVDVDLTAISRAEISQEQFRLVWRGGMLTTESNKKDDIQYFAAHLYQGGEMTKHKGKSGQTIASTGQTGWTALRSKYFTAALIPITPSTFGKISTFEERTPNSAVADSPPRYSMAVGLSSKNPAHYSLYLGPLKYSRIKALNVELEKTMNFGLSFIRGISKGILYLLVTMHDYIPNYGVLLIIFSVAVKILVYPLTKKSYQSTKEMQAVQPLIVALREKYGGDPQRLNKETMKLYKERGVNPLGGCLPMLLQMPLLFAIFTVFRTTIELSGAPFIWWIKDLSAPDTIYQFPGGFSVPIYGDHIAVLPILMGVSMFVQQKMSGVQAQPQQKLMMYFMTGFFLLLFNNFPSGLNLYYTLFNVLTILQQKYLIHPTSQPALPKQPQS